jgi:hypothetical protein
MPDASSLSMTLAPTTPALAKPNVGLRPVAGVVALAIALMTPAFWNGYPLLYFDTIDYISLGFTWRLPIYRTAGYGIFALGGWGTRTVWATLALQSLFVAYVLYEARRLLMPELRGGRLVAVLLIAFVLTSLPWVTSEIMPDVFTAPAVLLTMMLALHGMELTPLRRWIFVLLLAIAGMAHPTHIAVIGGLAICIFVMSWMAGRGWLFARMKVRHVVAGLALGLVFSIAANWAATGRIFFAPRTTPLLTFAVLFERGLAQRYLAETCDQPGVRQSVLCPYRAEMPTDANQFLWHNPNFWKIGGWNVLLPEAARDLEDIMRRYPLEFVTAAATLAVEQLVVIKTGEGFRSMVGFVDSEIRRFYPSDYADFLSARQQGYKELSDSPMPEINAVHVPAMLAGLVLLIGVLALAIRRRDRTVTTLAALILLAYIGNAVVCGAVSNPADRYGSRLAWLAALAAVALLPRVVRAPTTAGAPGTSSAAG